MVKTPKTAAPAAPKAPREPGSRQKILVFFLANMNRVIDHEEIQQASGNASEWARRTRELRDELGYQIRTDKDEPTVLKPGQYILRTDKRLPAFARNISKETRAWVLERNGYSCQHAGALCFRCLPKVGKFLTDVVEAPAWSSSSCLGSGAPTPPRTVTTTRPSAAPARC